MKRFFLLLFVTLSFSLHGLIGFYDIPVEHHFSEQTRRNLEGEAEKIEVLIELLKQNPDQTKKNILQAMLLYELRKAEKYCERLIYSENDYNGTHQDTLDELKEAENLVYE